MRRRNSAIGLFVSLAFVSGAQNANVSYPAIWNDLGLIGTLVFLVLLCIGPRKERKANKENED